SLTTSPWRTAGRFGDTDSDTTGPRTTSTAILWLARPARTVIVARPAPTPVTTPSSETRATVGALDDHSSRSRVRSFIFEKGTAVSRRSWPATIFAVFMPTVRCVAGPGRLTISSVESITGRVPGTIAVTANGNLPTLLATSVPDES